MLKAGIVGLPNVGKSTLFNALTRSRKAEAANYPFCTIDPNVGIVIVPDARLEGRIEEKLQPHSAFAIGFVRVMGNIGVLATWLVIAAYLMSHEAFFSDDYWVADDFAAKATCVIGVALGTTTWFCGLSFGISRTHGRIGENTLLRMQHFSGLCLIALGIFDGIRMAWQLSHHKL